MVFRRNAIFYATHSYRYYTGFLLRDVRKKERITFLQRRHFGPFLFELFARRTDDHARTNTLLRKTLCKYLIPRTRRLFVLRPFGPPQVLSSEVPYLILVVSGLACRRVDDAADVGYTTHTNTTVTIIVIIIIIDITTTRYSKLLRTHVRC